MSNKYLAIWNGYLMIAEKKSNRWTVGGDFPQKGDSVQIALPKDGRYAWHDLRGCFLKFSDWVSKEDEHLAEKPHKIYL